MNSVPCRSTLFATACLAFVAFLAVPAASRASPVGNDDLFLPPALIPDGDYDTHYLTFETATSVVQTYTNADIGGTLLGVRILPVLNPNPAPTSSEGEYTAADLATITVSNYGQYFFREPGSDYFADLTPSAISVDYRASGQYFVEILAKNNGVQFTRVFHDQVDDFFAEDPPTAGKDKAGVTRKIPLPVADLYLVSDSDPNDNGAMKNASALFEDEGLNPQKVNSLAAVRTAIENAYKANGNKKIEVVLTGHGRGLPRGSIKIGTERINNDTDGNQTPEDFQKSIDQWVHSIQFYSCNTGEDKAFRDAIANSISEVTSFAVPVTFAAPSWWGLFSGYIDLSAGAKKAFDVPEPSTLLLVAASGAAMLAARRKRPAA